MVLDFEIYIKVSFGEACSSSDTSMHIEAVALPLVIRGAEVAPKCLSTLFAVEKKVRQFGKWRLSSKVKNPIEERRKIDKKYIQGETKGRKGG